MKANPWSRSPNSCMLFSRQTIYNWVDRFQQRQDPDLRARLADAPRQGRPPTALGIIDPLIAEIIAIRVKLGYYATGWTVPHTTSSQAGPWDRGLHQEH